MAYQTPITIKKAIDNITEQRYVLPSIQREFVWKTKQIEILFDSLMRGYPIGTFLFWNVDKSKTKDFQFYSFLQKYHEKKHQHNIKSNLSGNDDVIALLDGQQRLTSLYIALVGTYAYKKSHMPSKNPKAYPERKLYLNLFYSNTSDESEIEYDFRFLTQQEVKDAKSSEYWFNCQEILSFTETGDKTVINYLSEINTYLEKHELKNDLTKIALNTLNRFYSVIHKDGTISFYLEEGKELDKVLQIFIRINSGGTKLSYSDLLLSIATAQWNKKDAREIIHEFVDEINTIGEGFAFNKDLVLKNCLVLADFSNIKFKVDNFTQKNMEKIQEDWEQTSSSLRTAIELVAKFGYNEKSLVATNAVIPIAYFIYKNECDDQILNHARWENARNAIKEWLARVLLKGTFGGTPDAIYPEMRKLINNNSGRFPLKETIAFYRKKRKSISFNSDDIEQLLELQYGKAKTYCALTLIYPALANNSRYHQDHMHPKANFTNNAMKMEGFSNDEIRDFNAEKNGIANLQLLTDYENQKKNNMPLKDWVDEFHPANESKPYILIDTNQSLEFKDFLNFIDARKEKIKGLFESILGVTAEENK